MFKKIGMLIINLTFIDILCLQVVFTLFFSPIVFSLYTIPRVALGYSLQYSTLGREAPWSKNGFLAGGRGVGGSGPLKWGGRAQNPEKGQKTRKMGQKWGVQKGGILGGSKKGQKSQKRHRGQKMHRKRQKTLSSWGIFGVNQPLIRRQPPSRTPQKPHFWPFSGVPPKTPILAPRGGYPPSRAPRGEGGPHPAPGGPSPLPPGPRLNPRTGPRGPSPLPPIPGGPSPQTQGPPTIRVIHRLEASPHPQISENYPTPSPTYMYVYM